MTYCLTAYPEAGAGLVSLERIDWDAPPGQDARFVSDVSGTVPPQAYHPFAQSAIAPQSLSVIGDGLDLGVMPFPTSGFALLADPVTLASVGYPYTARAVLHPVEFGTGSGTSQAQAQSDNRVSVRFLDTVHCNVDGEPLDWRSMDVAPTLDTPPAPFSGVKHIMLMGWNHDDGRTIELTQDKPYPWHVLAVIRSVTVNAG
jgi:hypothetical protein